MADDETKDGGEEQKPSMIKKLMMPLVLSLVTAGIAIGALNFFGVISIGGKAEMAEGMEGEEGADGEEAVASGKAGMPAFFFKLYPDMLVALTNNGKSRYLKLTIEVMSREETVVEGVEQYHPIIRNNLLKLFQEVDFDLVSSPQGVEALQEIAAEEIERVLKQYHGPNAIEGVYFTSFVVQ